MRPRQVSAFLALLVTSLVASLTATPQVAAQPGPETIRPHTLSTTFGGGFPTTAAMAPDFVSRGLPASAPQTATTPNRSRGALIGGGIGLVVGAVLGGLSVQDEEVNGSFGEGSSLAEGVATGAAVIGGGLFGLAVGAVLGATVFAPSSPVAAASSARVAWHPTVSVDPASGAWRAGVLLQGR